LTGWLKRLARGKLLRTKVKEAKKVAEASAMGKLMGEYKANEKILKKQGIIGFVKTKITSTLNNLNADELIKLITFGTTTLIIYELIQTWDVVANKITSVVQNIGSFTMNPIGNLLMVLFSFLTPQTTETPITPEIKETLNPFMFGLSVILAYLLVYKTEAVGLAVSAVGSGISSLAGLAGFLIGV